MKVIRIVKPYTLIVEEAENDSQLADESALVRVRKISICGSDIKLYNGQYSGPNVYPIVFGHEWSGEILKVNSDSSRLKEGDIVVGDCSRWCGSCCNCRLDKNLCENIDKFGITIDGFARELVIVPVKYLYKVPLEIPIGVAALTEPFAVAMNGLKKLTNKMQLFNKYLILGAGPIGAAVYVLLRDYYKISSVDIYDPISNRIDLLTRIYHDINSPNINICEKSESSNYRVLYKNDQYSCIIIATGNAEAIQLALKYANTSASILLLGMFPESTIDINKVVIKSLSFFGSIGGTGSFEDIISFFKEYNKKVSNLITHSYGTTEVEKAFLVNANEQPVMKIQIEF